MADAPQRRPVAIFSPGPVAHLFRAGGVYFLRELLNSHDVVLVAFELLAGLPEFEAARRWPGVLETHLLPHPASGFSYHRASCDLGGLMRQFQPAMLLQHGDSYPHNLYFIAAARHLPNCLKITFGAGFTYDMALDSDHLAAARVFEIACRFHLPRWLASGLFRWWRFQTWLRDFLAIPLMVQGRPLPHVIDTQTGRVLRRDTSALTDLHLLYFERERQQYARYLSPKKISLIRHPLQVVGDQVHQIFGMPAQRNGIVFLPTLGYVDTLGARLGSLEEAAKQMAALWRDVLLVLRERLGWPVYAKLHPSAGKNLGMVMMMEQLQREVPGLTVLEPHESAERAIMAGRCVVGDMSSVLWWSLLLGGRTVISVDGWGMEGGDEFRHYDGVVYVRTPDELRTADLQPAFAGGTKGLPRLTDVIAAG